MRRNYFRFCCLVDTGTRKQKTQEELHLDQSSSSSSSSSQAQIEEEEEEEKTRTVARFTRPGWPAPFPLKPRRAVTIIAAGQLILPVTPATTTNNLNRPSRVMVVDDDLICREFLRGALEKNGCTVATAESVDAALKVFATRGIQWFDTVLTDFQMPGLTGLDLVAWMQQQDVPLSSIILTGEGDKQLVKDSLRAGVSDFLEKPVNLPKLFPALTKAVAETHRRRQFAATASAVKDLGRTQRGLINLRPIAVPGGVVTVELAFHPKVEAGGDFFCHFQPTPEKLVCLLTDVSGHDLQAAYVSAYFQGVVRGMKHAGTPMPEIFRYFNRYLTDEWGRAGQFRRQNSPAATSVAALSVVLDFSRHTVTALPCGAPAPIQILPDGRAQRIGLNGGAPLGWFPEFEPEAFTQPFIAGTSLVFWTDGLDDLAQSLNVHSLTAVHALALARHNGNESALLAHAQDDVLCASLRLPGYDPRADHFIPLLLDEYHGAQADEIDQLTERWRHHLKFSIADLTATAEHDILLATREAALNAMQHGCAADQTKPFTVQISFQRTARKVKVWVDDPGAGHDFDFAAHEKIAAEQMLAEHRGLILIQHLAHTVTRERHGATVIMEFQL